MTSSTGWFRANFVYDTLQEPPTPGSPLEAVCAFIFMSRQRVSFLTTKAYLQAYATQDSEKALQESLDAIHDAAFPYEKQERECQQTTAREIMERFKGPIRVSTT
jgi:hypothetical protein